MRPVIKRLAVVAVCLTICVGVQAGKRIRKIVNIDREDILRKLEEYDRDRARLTADAGRRLAQAEALIAGGDGELAVVALNEIIQADLPATREAQKVLALSYMLLGELYSNLPAGASRKALVYYDLAMGVMDPAVDAVAIADTARRMADVHAGLGEPGESARLLEIAGDAETGEPFTRLSRTLMENRAIGHSTVNVAGDDTCDQSIVSTVPGSEMMAISFNGDHNWRTFTLTAPTLVTIETISPNTFADDTYLNLWGECVGSNPDDFILFDEDGGVDFLSKISLCLDAGTYYLQVGGFNDVTTTGQFELSISDDGSCAVPAPDAYEPDDEISLASPINFRHDITLPAPGPDSTSTVSLPRGVGFGSVQVSTPPAAGGRTRKILQRRAAVSSDGSSTDADFDGPMVPAAGEGEGEGDPDGESEGEEDGPDAPGDPNRPGDFNPDAVQHHTIFPAGDVDFVTFNLVRPTQVRIETEGPPTADTVMGLSTSFGMLFAINDNKDPNSLTSRLDFCLPPGDWYVPTIGFNTAETFNYEIFVDAMENCPFEVEPNALCDMAQMIPLNSRVSGLQTSGGVAENDWFSFTLQHEQLVTIETHGWDEFAVDTFLILQEGCPGTVIEANDDGGAGFLSRIQLTLPGGTYYVDVTVSPFSIGANFPYDLTIAAIDPPVSEQEPNNSCTQGNPMILDETVLAAISPIGDRDNFTLTLPADGIVEIETAGGVGDTVLQISSMDGSTVIGCNDDGGDNLFSKWSCCLLAGEYCVTVKDFDDSQVIPGYTVDFRDLGTCVPDPSGSCPIDGLGCPF